MEVLVWLFVGYIYSIFMVLLALTLLSQSLIIIVVLLGRTQGWCATFSTHLYTKATQRNKLVVHCAQQKYVFLTVSDN